MVWPGPGADHTPFPVQFRAGKIDVPKIHAGTISPSSGPPLRHLTGYSLLPEDMSHQWYSTRLLRLYISGRMVRVSLLLYDLGPVEAQLCHKALATIPTTTANIDYGPESVLERSKMQPFCIPRAFCQVFQNPLKNETGKVVQPHGE